MAVAGAIKSAPDATRRRRNYRIGLTFSGNYANTGTTGDLLSFTSLTNSIKIERAFPHRVPKDIGDIQVRNHPPGYVITVEKGSVITGAVGIRVWQTKDPGNAGGADIALQELPNGAYPAALTDAGMANKPVIEVSEEN